jgi:flavorubredoxin
MMVFEETTSSLFPADLYIQPGDQPPIVQENLGELMCGFHKEVGIFAAEEPVRRVVDRIERLNPQCLHPMHGGSLPGDMIPAYTQALKNDPFAFEGKVFGRTIPG